jgi:hypothetical protein
MPQNLTLQALTANKWARRVVWALSGLLALWGLAWLVVPPLLRHQVEKIATEQLGRNVSLGKVEFSPWSMELTVHDLAVAKADGSAPQLGIQRIYVNAELESIFRLAPVMDAITIDAPQLNLTHLGDGRYDIDDVLARLNQPATEPAGAPARFALYNIAVSGGTLDFVDKAVNKSHEVRDFKLGIPFLSNLESQRTVKTSPYLAFRLNGSEIDTTAQSTPFAQTRKTDAQIKLSQLDLKPYLGYLPAALPVRLQGAVLSADLTLAFEQGAQSQVRLSGTVAADKLRVATPTGGELLAVDRIDVALRDVRLLAQVVDLSRVEITAPRLTVARLANGQLNLLPSAVRSDDKSVQPAQERSAKNEIATKAKPSAWQVAVAEVVLKSGAASWTDEAVQPKAQASLSQLELSASGITYPFTQPTVFQGNSLLDKTTLTFAGQATDVAASATLSLNGLPLAMASPYLAQFLTPSLNGQLGADVGVQWAAAGPLQLSAKRIDLSNLALTQGKSALASVKAVNVSGVMVDLTAQTVRVDKLALAQPRTDVERNKDGRWMYEQWLKAPATGRSAQTGTATVAATTATTATWAATLGELTVAGGPISFTDKMQPKPVSFEVSAIQLRAQQLVLGGTQTSPISLSLRLGSGQAEAGKLDLKGQLTAQPLSAQLSIDAQRLPVHAFEPYFADALNVELLRADTSFKGQMQFATAPAGTTVRVTGDTNVEDLRANSVAGSAAAADVKTGDELLAWKALSLRGFDLQMAPTTALRVNVRETVLSDFYARVVLRESGRLNLQDIVKSSADSTATPSGPEPVIAFGPISLVNGKVQFSDRFIKPNYSANLSELTGRLGAFSSVSTGTPQLADLELRGKAEGTAALEILGQLNPLAKPLALDIKGTVRNLELPPLSPYSIKYAGHGIERGKLSVDVSYVVQPNGQLDAKNKIVLNQLAFGEAIQGAPNSLPVKLAVALLADRNGVIDIDLPVSGSLNDPQFSLGSVIFKIIGNLIVKAITAPFSLLASALGGGGDELSTVAFAPGSATLSDTARQGLDKVAKALTDRPALKMTVIGTSRLEVEREAFKRARLQQLLVAEKRRAAVVAGASSGTAATTTLSVSAAEAPALLKEVYRRADMPKPRNAVGLTKDIPAPEMEALLLANIPATEQDMRDLALARGVAVRDYLGSQKLDAERLFLGAIKTGDDKSAAGAAAGASPAAKASEWSPRAELNLAAK